MRILLDTHVFIWIATLHRLSETATAHFLDADNQLYFSMASYWEIAIKIGLGKLTLSDQWVQKIESIMSTNGITWLPIAQAHCQVVTTLPHLHGDPFDRMLIAQALSEELTLMTADAKIQQYRVPTLW